MKNFKKICDFPTLVNYENKKFSSICIGSWANVIKLLTAIIYKLL